MSIGELFAEVEPEDLIKYGLIPELVGRLPVACALDSLDKDALLRILTEPKNAITKQFKKLFEMDEIELTFDESALRMIVTKTITKGTGARGLRAVLESSMLELMYLLPSEGGPKEIHVTEELINNPQSAFLHLEQKKQA
jgi:ATP-dependent Clp protease ATP-binding subunit ClpX